MMVNAPTPISDCAARGMVREQHFLVTLYVSQAGRLIDNSGTRLKVALDGIESSVSNNTGPPMTGLADQAVKDVTDFLGRRVRTRWPGIADVLVIRFLRT